VETHNHSISTSLMGFPSTSSLLSLIFPNVASSQKNHMNKNAKSTFLFALVVFLAISSLCECTSEKDQLATQQKQLNPFQQHLVRRSFLRFGKRSNPALSNANDDDDDDYYSLLLPHKPMKRADDPAPTGPGEQYAAMLMGKQPHSTSARSFLRFGRSGLSPTQSMASSKRRADNFLRFGKRVPDDHREEQMLGRWKKFLLVMLAKVAEEEEELLHSRQVMDKKSSDFLRFG